MAFRIQVLFIYSALCLLSFYNANAFKLFDLAKLQPRIVGFSWKECGPASDIAQITSLTVTPDPIEVPGNITVGTAFTVSKAGPTDLSVEVVMEVKVAGFYIKVPCIDTVGSCTYNDLCADWADACPKYFSKYGIPCTCPIPANTYTVAGAVVDITAKLPAKISGDIRITGNLVSASAGHIACLEVEVNLKSG